MNVLMIVLLGLGAGAALGVLAFMVALARVPAARARRVALAGAMGGAVAFTFTALVQLPFFTSGGIAVPLATSALAGAVGASLAAAMILRAGAPS
ncbi:MAG: hypothetical protein BGN85_08350 [Alphaproteobacteria bacterium 64-11]|nr:hypothetical protein [Alphaproteobacteria bacterium]OJU09035.1 MAG: hypothetical protein BGN85_08350 [Alphaproteobacteria bacterium 64-11]